MGNGKTLSIIVPALNEEANIRGSLRAGVYAAEKNFSDYEVIVIDDGSTDRTAAIVEEHMKNNPKIMLIRHESSRNIGACYMTGRGRARMDYCVLISGDDPCDDESLSQFFSHVGQADFICAYWANPEIRPLSRRLFSVLYTGLLNKILGLQIKYYNGLQVHRTTWLKNTGLESHGFGFYAETLWRAVREGKTYREFSLVYKERPQGGVTKALRLGNWVSVMKTVCLLLKLRNAKQIPKREIRYV